MVSDLVLFGDNVVYITCIRYITEMQDTLATHSSFDFYFAVLIIVLCLPRLQKFLFR